MKTSKHIFLIVLIFNIFQNRSFSQNIDSLKLVLKSVKNDTIKCNVLSILSETAEDNEWPAFNDELKSVCEKNLKNKNLSAKMKFFYLKHLAISLNNIGYLSEDEGNIDKALEYYKKSLE